MKCEEVEKLLLDYLSGDISASQRQLVEEHLSRCARCRKALAACNEAKQHLASLKHTPVPPDFTKATMMKIKASETRSRFQQWLRPALAAGAAVIILAILLVTQPWSVSSPEALAASIVRNSPEVQAALDGEKIEEVEVTTKVVDDEGEVLLVWVRTETRAVAAEVNLERKKVTELIRVDVPEFKTGDEQKAIDIAKADSRVQELLAQGAVINEVSLGHSINIEDITGPDGVTRKEGSVKVMGTVFIELGNKEWHATVDLDEGRVIGLAKPSAAMILVHISRFTINIVAPFVLALGVLIIIGLALRNRLAGAVAGIASIALGIIGLFIGLYSMSSVAWYIALIVAVPVVGLVIGIADIRRRTSRRWVAITGMALCSLALAYELFAIIIVPDRQAGIVIAVVLVIMGVIVYAFYNKIKIASRKWLRTALAIGAAVIVLAVLLVTQPWGLSPQSVMVKAYAATESLQSYRMFSSIKSTLEGETSEATFETEFVAPDRHRGKATMNGDWFEFIIVGDKQYIWDSDPSRKTSVRVSSSSILSKEDTLKIIDSLTELEKLPDEPMDGTDCIHYRGRVDMERKVEELKAKLDSRQPHYEEMLKGLEDMRNMKTEVEIWIGKEDYLIRQIKRDTQVPSEDTGMLDTSSSVVKYYDFNAPIIIEPPLDAHGELLPGWCLASSPSAETFFYCETHSEITGEDPAHQQISLSATITNVGMEAAASNVQVDLRNSATIKGEKEESWINAEPSTSGPVSLEPGESETYSVSWEYDASHITREELVELLEQTVIRIAYITPEGNEAVRMYSVGGAPYPSAIPPERPPG